MPDSLKKQTISGIKWSYISTISTAIMQLLYTSVMARLLTPADFGLVAIGGVVLRFAKYFAQMGLSSAIIQKKELVREDIDAAFTSSIFLGFFSSLIIAIFAPLSVYIFDNQDVINVVRVMGLTFITNGIALTPVSLLRRNLEFLKLTIVEVVSFIIGYLLVGIGLANLGFRYWSLVFASLSQSSIIAIFSVLLSKHKISFTFSWENYKPLLSFGSRISLISFFGFIGGSMDVLLIGRFLGSEKLGFYNRAYMLMSLPMTYMVTSFSNVLFPWLSKIRDDTSRLNRNFLWILYMINLVLFPFSVVVSVLSREIVIVVLGDKWLMSVNVLRILAFGITIDYLIHLIAVLFEAKGFLRDRLVLQFCHIFFLLILYLYFMPLGIEGFALAFLLAQIARLVVYSFLIIYRLKVKLTDILMFLPKPLFVSLLIFFLYTVIQEISNLGVYKNMAIFLLNIIIFYPITLYLILDEESKIRLRDLLLTAMR